MKMRRKAKPPVHCVICGKNVRDPETGKVSGWVFDAKWWMSKKNNDWGKTQLGEFAFLLDPDVGELNICIECKIRSLGMTPARIKAVLGGTFR